MATTKPVITIPELPDPATMLDSQIEAAQANMDALKPAVDAFRAWEQFASQLLDVKEGKVKRTGNGPRKARASGERAPRGDRPAEFLQVVKDAGPEGITVSEAADKMGMSGPNYLYRLAPDLADKGLVRKEGKKYIVVEGEDAPDAEEGTETASAA